MARAIELPRDHFIHLKELAFARKQDLYETACFLHEHGQFSDANWLPGRYPGDPSEMHRVVIPQGGSPIDREKLMQAIQALPRWIKSKTDSPISDDYSFNLMEDGTQSVTIRGRTFFDPTPVGPRETAIYEFLKDRFSKPMTLKEFQILSFCQSQYATLLDEPERYVMPSNGQVAIDAGSFIGYKAMAMADIVGPNGKVYAIEMEAGNFALQNHCFKVNNVLDFVRGIHCALGSREEECEMLSETRGSMRNSLTNFEGFGSHLEKTNISTRRLDSLLREAGIDWVDNLHVSVNGFEPQVLEGLGDYVHKVGTFCVMAPYQVNGVEVAKLVSDFFAAHNVKVWGRSQAAIVAGPQAGNFPVQPLK
jgi:FkbM family methyltransferase